MKSDQNNSFSDTPQTMKKSRASIILSIISVCFIGLTALFILIFWDYIKDPTLLRERIGDHYVIGALFMVLISAVQVIVALVPGEFVEISAGYIFGSVWGSVLCLIGIVLGSCITILLVRRFGLKFVYVFYPKEKLDDLPILNDPTKRNLLVFILFVIPGTPKDLFTYAIGLTNMSIPLYVALTTAARFPSVILSTLSGDAVGTKNYTSAIIFIIVTAIVSGIGILIYRAISKRHKENPKNNDSASNNTAPKDEYTSQK